MTGGRRNSRRSAGQSLVEFALVLPVIIVIVLGLIDVGRGVFAYNTLAQAARQAARMAIVDQDATRVSSVAVAMAPTLGLSTSNVDVCFKRADSTQRDCSNPSIESCGTPLALGCLAIVRTHTTFTPIAPLIGSIVGSIPLSSTSIEPIEYVCPNSVRTTCP